MTSELRPPSVTRDELLKAIDRLSPRKRSVVLVYLLCALPARYLSDRSLLYSLERAIEHAESLPSGGPALTPMPVTRG